MGYEMKWVETGWGKGTAILFVTVTLLLTLHSYISPSTLRTSFPYSLSWKVIRKHRAISALIDFPPKFMAENVASHRIASLCELPALCWELNLPSCAWRWGRRKGKVQILPQAQKAVAALKQVKNLGSIKHDELSNAGEKAQCCAIEIIEFLPTHRR